jgi:hypothetical protein
MTFPSLIFAQSTAGRQASDTILLPIFLRHDQSLNLTEIQKLQEEQVFGKRFPLKAAP